MSKLITISKIKWIMNLLIILIFVQVSGIILAKLYELFFQPDGINILRLDVPWNHPIGDVTVMLNKNILQNDPNLLQKINKNIFTYDLIKRIIFLPILLLILCQLKKLIIAILGKTFFKRSNILIIRNLSILVSLWVLSYFIMYQIIPIFIPVYLITESINYIPINDSFLHNILIAIDFKMLFVAIILYIISISFKEGYQLKEQIDLTI